MSVPKVCTKKSPRTENGGESAGLSESLFN
jgi:hypothetical protein